MNMVVRGGQGFSGKIRPINISKKSLPERVQKGQIGGWSLATRSFPLRSFGTNFQGRSLPDAILRDLRSCRPHSRAVQCFFKHMDYWVRLICPHSQWLRPLTRGPSWDKQVTNHVLALWQQVSHRFWRRVCLCHGSRLLPLRLPFHLLCSAKVFASSPRLQIVFTAFVFGSWLSRHKPRFLFSFRRISSGWPFLTNFWFLPCWSPSR